LICWEVTIEEIDSAERAGAARVVVDSARTFAAERIDH
jgi:hypothetical protein